MCMYVVLNEQINLVNYDIGNTDRRFIGYYIHLRIDSIH